MTADPAMVTAKISGGSADSAHSAWSGILEKLQHATLGEFQVIRELGRGGMAAVYLAHDIHLDRKVAIKVMSPMLASDQRMVERFRREAKTGAGLKHPNIGTVHRVLEGEGLYFFVMDFIRGRPLDVIIQRNGVLTVEVTRALLYQIGSGLAYAHRRKIYHRDVKPGNVLVSGSDGTAVVTDFGIAKVAESTNQTQTGAIVGTPSYMAPEQILGREITQAADQYAFGVMAYEMLTGAPPFVGTSFVVMHAHTEIQPRSIRESRPDCPPELDDAIMRMLAKDPLHRWPSLPHALAAMGATLVGEDDPIREELVRLATPDEVEKERFTTHTPRSPRPTPTGAQSVMVAMVAISPPPEVIEVGDLFRLAASARDVKGAEIPNATIEWATNNADVLRVHSDGTVTALTAGPAEISATAGRARGAVLVTVEPGRVSSLQLSVPPGVLMAGDRIQLAARVIDKHQRQLGYAVRWGVGDPNIARVSPDGVLEARAPGVVEVYAESNGVRNVARVQIAPPAVAGLQLSVDPQRPAVGDRIRVTATPVDSHGRALRDRALGWSLSDLSLVTILSDGVYEAIATGTLRVTAASEGKSATIDVAIAPAPVAALKVSPAPHTVVAGATFKLTAVAVDAKGTALGGHRVDWSTSDLGVATIADDGTVTALNAGDVRIVASCEGKGASIAVSVKPAPVGAVKITGLPPIVYVKAPFRLAATVTDTRGRQLQKTVEWRSANVSVVTINQHGQATAHGVGQVRISALVEGVEGVVDVNVLEPAIPKVVVVPAAPVAPPSAPPSAPRAAVGDLSASAIFSPQMRPASARVSATPVMAPPVITPPKPAPSRSRGVLIGGGIGALVLVGVVATLLSKKSTPVVPADSTPAAPVVAPPADTATAPQQQAQPPAVAVPSPAPDSVSSKSTPAAKTAAKNPVAPPQNPAPKTTPLPAPVADAFRVTVAPQGTMRVGDNATLRATVERAAGTGAMPRVTWESNRPSVLRVDASTGAASAIAEGQATVTASAGGARAEIPVTVQAAPAPVVAPAPVRQNPPPAETPARPTAPTAEELRAKAETALQSAANAMAAALKAKNVSQANQLFADGQNPDAVNMLNGLKDYFGLNATVGRINPVQVADRSASVEYQLVLSWTTQVGIQRNRTLTMKAEAERSGDTWTVARQRILGGWR
jgi:serine/threonine protein kinase/uncharacterized protein YjdB